MIPLRDSKDNDKMYEAKLKAYFKNKIKYIIKDREDSKITRNETTYIFGELVEIENVNILHNIILYLMKDIKTLIYNTFTLAEECSSSGYVFMLMRDEYVGYSEYIRYDESLGLLPVKIEDIFIDGDGPAIISDYILQMDSPKFNLDKKKHHKIMSAIYHILREIYQGKIKNLEEGKNG